MKKQLSVIDQITNKTANQYNLTDEVVHAVIYHQWKSLREHMETCNTLEVSGFGKFSTRPRKIASKLKKMQDMQAAYQKQKEKLLPGEVNEALDKKLASCQNEIAYLLNKQVSNEL